MLLKDINEYELEQKAKCPIMVSQSPSEVGLCGYLLASKALRAAFEGKHPVLADIRGDYIRLWNQAWFKGKENKIPIPKAGDPYWKGIHSGRTISYRLFNLLLAYEVLHPEQSYYLILNGYTIQGSYALLRKRKGAGIPTVLILYMHAPTLQHDQAVPPRLVALSRYVDAKMSEVYKEIHVLHYPLLKGKEWINKYINEALAKVYLYSMLEVENTSPVYPTIGEHCKDCSTKPCLEVFNIGRQNDHRRY